ncbi:hypothetical protein QEG73_20755 [Chitinophagaceae bacterium 26-R-25]|nr:hypothetical protein [Chitinophagaceae bacterium 26-R-25]
MDKRKTHKIFYTATLVIGFLLLALEINIYQKTIIPISNIIVVICLISVITYVFIKNDYRNTYHYKNLLFPLIQSIFSFGFIACYIFVASNFYFAHSDIRLKSCLISSKHTIGTKNPNPAIEIDYEGITKQLVFSTKQKEEVDTSQAVLLTIRKGFWGYDVFYDIELK